MNSKLESRSAYVILLRRRLLINDDIDAIILRGEERTSELNSRYEGLNLEDLSNFKSEASVQQWEGEDFRTGVCVIAVMPYLSNMYVGEQRKPLNFNLLSLSKRERKSNYSVDNYFKDTLRAGPSKPEKAAKIPRAPKQISMFVLSCSFLPSSEKVSYSQDFQFFPPELAQLQERELAVHKVSPLTLS